MFLPIGDAPNPKGTPFVTWALIGVNVAAFLLLNLPLGARQADFSSPAFREYVEVMTRQLDGRVDVRQLAAQTSEYDLFAFEHGFRPSAPQAVDLLTCMFLHGSFMHLFGNMLFLWIYGDNVERRLGAIGYLVAYLGTGIAATLSHALVFRSSEVPLVGASGAISGVLGFYFVFFPRNVVRMLVFLPPFLMNVFQIPARLVLGMFLVVDNLLPFLFSGEGGVAHGAHIGGVIVGAAVAFAMQRTGFSRAPEDLEPERRPTGTGDVHFALADGRYEDAARAYFALGPDEARRAISPHDAVALAQWLRDRGYADAALTLLKRVIRDRPHAAGIAEAHALAGSLLLRETGDPAEAYQYLRAALDLAPRPETAAFVRQELAAIEGLQKRRIGTLRGPTP